MNDVERRHKGYFFTKDTMKFFGSKTYDTAIELNSRVWFITSEKSRYDSARAYTIRYLKGESINTYGQFQGFGTKKQAEKRLGQLLGIKNFIA